MTTADNRRRRLLALIKEQFGTQAEFVRRTGENQGAISAILSGARPFGEKKARDIEDKAGVQAGWLDQATADESAVNPTSVEKQSVPPKGQGASASTYNALQGDNFEPGPDLRPRRYPEISWVQAGMWTENCENFVPDEHTIWHQCHIDLGPCGFVVSVRGPSMTAPAGIHPSFPDGIKLFVSPDSEALPSKFVIVRRDGKATFKKLTLVDGDLYLEAINPDWPDRYIRVQDHDHFCGVVRHAGFDL